jgi:hypothetical protein
MIIWKHLLDSFLVILPVIYALTVSTSSHHVSDVILLIHAYALSTNAHLK